MGYGLRYRDQLPPIIVDELDGLVAAFSATTATLSGTVGPTGATGAAGATGLSAYEIAVLAGYTGSQADYAAALGTTVTLTLTNAQVLALNGTPLTMVAAPGANKVLIPQELTFSTNLTGAYGETYSLNLYYAGDTTKLMTSVGSLLNTTTRKLGQQEPVSQGVTLSVASNKALTLSNETGSFTGGNAANAVKVTLKYFTIDV